MVGFKSLLVVSVVVSQSAMAAGSKTTFFESDGHNYSYTTKLGRGLVRIQGQVIDTGDRFSLIVDRNGWVSGEFEGVPVTYVVTNKESERLFKNSAETPVAGDDEAR